MEYDIDWTREAENQLVALKARNQRVVVEGIERHLRHEPNVETRNRKKMKPNDLALWELRLRDFRVYYDVYVEPNPSVLIIAIGVKDGNAVFIAGERVDL